MRMVRRLFPDFNVWLSDLPDARDPDLRTYSGRALVWTTVMMYATRLGARRQIGTWLDDNELALQRLGWLAQELVESVPHGDTIDDFLSTLDPAQTQKISHRMGRTLLETRRLEEFRLLGRYYLLGADMSGHLYLGDRKSKFTQGCLTQKTGDGRTLYYRPTVEGKLLTRTGLALSIGSEFVENPADFDPEGDTPQDSELPAAMRLFAHIKEAYPRYPFCLLLDARYCNETTFALCQQYDWRFIITLKEGSIPSVWKEFQVLRAQTPQNRCVTTGPDQTEYHYAWVNDIAYGTRTLNVLECTWTDEDGDHRFVWATDIRVSAKNCDALAHEGGRQRWKIENNGFRAQKQEGFEMEHAYAMRLTSAKNFYLILQIAHSLCQLFECYWHGKKAVKKAFGSLQNLGRFLLESLRRDPLMDTEALQAFLTEPIQIRLNSP